MAQTGSLTEVAPIEARVRAVESVLARAGIVASNDIAELEHAAQERWVPDNGAKVVAKAWLNPDYKQRLLANGKSAVEELGFGLPPHHRHLVVLENTDRVHNVICCSLCSCTAFSIIGLPPDWYKDFEYRSRVVRQARTVLAEMGLDLPPEVEVRVWDTTADTRYMVLPMRPAGTEGWDATQLAALVTKESMIGVSRLVG
jgi:nitrile hydratase subunit alpha